MSAPVLLGMIADIMKKESRAHWSAKLDALGVPAIESFQICGS